MATRYLFQRIIQNHFNWQRPSPGRLGPNGEGEYVKKNGFGHEDWNFNKQLTINGFVYGYIYYPVSDEKSDDSFNIAFGTYINSHWYLVGFYLNVTYDPNPPCNLKILEIKKDDILQLNRSLGDPWKQYSEKKILTELKKESGALHWRVKPEHIIPINRPIKISPKIFNTANRHITSPTGIDKSTFINLKRLVGENIFSETHLNKSAGIKQPDIAKRQEIENTAMEAVKGFYKKSGFNVIDVSDQCKGWDYEATKEYYTIYIEVKGRSSNDVSAELTPNEYQKMKDNKEKYVLCIVTSALIKPELHIFKWQSDNRWLSEKGKVLHFNEKIGAEVSI